MMDILRMELKVERENQLSKMETDLMDGGLTMKFKVKARMYLSMEMYMKDKSKWERDMEREHTYMKMEMSLLVIGKMI